MTGVMISTSVILASEHFTDVILRIFKSSDTRRKESDGLPVP